MTILDADCGICEGINRWAKQAQRAAFRSSESKSTIQFDPPQVSSSQIPLLKCPPDYSELGRATWTFLHTMAAYYPSAPTTRQQNDMNEFLTLFSQLYPCQSCAQDFARDIKLFPPTTQSVSSLSEWMCRMHNRVNEKLGKKSFDCSRVLERWRFGSDTCLDEEVKDSDN